MENSAIAYFNEITSDCSRLKSRSVLHIRDDIINVHLLPESAGVCCKNVNKMEKIIMFNGNITLKD
jgi:hypothetical protein